jgi:hypothetical protein
MTAGYDDEAFRKALTALAPSATDRPESQTGPLGRVRAAVTAPTSRGREGGGTTTLTAIAALLRDTSASGLDFKRDEKSNKASDFARVPWTSTTAGVFVSTVDRADPAPALKLRDQLNAFSTALSDILKEWNTRSVNIEKELATEDAQIAAIRPSKKAESPPQGPRVDPTSIDRVRLRGELDVLDRMAYALNEAAEQVDASYSLLRELLLVQSAVAVADESRGTWVPQFESFPPPVTRNALNALRKSFNDADAARRMAQSLQTS